MTSSHTSSHITPHSPRTAVSRIVPHLVWSALVITPAALCQRTTVSAPGGVPVTTIANVGFNGPENIVYDSVADVFLVSNIAGDPAARDNNGFISRVAPDGRVLTLHWIAGGTAGVVLDAPKGLAIRGDTLAVADVGSVRLFNRRTGAVLGTITIPGIIMNDVAFSRDGTLWITDTGPDRTTTPVDTSKDMDALWRVPPGGHAIVVTRGLSLDRPDGLVLEKTSAIIATFGGRRLERVSSDTPGRRDTVATLPNGHLDGLRWLSDSSFVVTSWDARTVWRLTPGRAPQVLLTGVTSPAGVAVDTRRHRLAVTSLENNTLYLLPLH